MAQFIPFINSPEKHPLSKMALKSSVICETKCHQLPRTVSEPHDFPCFNVFIHSRILASVIMLSSSSKMGSHLSKSLFEQKCSASSLLTTLIKFPFVCPFLYLPFYVETISRNPLAFYFVNFRFLHSGKIVSSAFASNTFL